MPTYIAHSAPSGGGKPQTMHEHLSEVARRAAESASFFGREQDAHLAGLLHDVGKYSDRFLRRLQGQEHGLDHWSAGAWLALFKHSNIPVALAIQGHHVGLQCGASDGLYALNPVELAKSHPLNLTLTETDTELLYQRLLADGFHLGTAPPQPAKLGETSATMLETRMLFSALVDADFLDTEKHFTGTAREAGLALEPEKAFQRLQEYLDEKVRKEAEVSDEVRQLREGLWGACLEKASEPTGLWTLTAPTGSGKTLAMLAFGLQHAIQNGLRRLIFVVPYLTIIDQTVKVYREIFEPVFGTNYVLDHHSLARWKQETATKRKDQDAESAGIRRQKLLAENWDAPIIVTTSVQALESLLNNRPAACRKLHALTKSVVLFDEVQTLPLTLVLPTLQTLSRLAQPDFGTSVVFATATQPAFPALDAQVKEEGNQGWQPREIAPARLYQIQRRVEVDWSRATKETDWSTLAEEIAGPHIPQQVLCIVNMRKDAQALVAALEKLNIPAVFHLSTWMCPAHRDKTLKQVSTLLKQGKPCRLVATSCVEAGVDVDFVFGFRALAPLPSIAQAAGRVNRNGLRPTERLVVFLPQDAAYPDDHFVQGRKSGAYRQAADQTRTLLEERGADRMQLDDPDLFTTFYKRLYTLTDLEKTELYQEWQKATKRQDYVKVAELYQLIPQDTVNVLVPYRSEGKLDAYNTLAQEARDKGLSRDWIQRAKPLLVSLFRNQAVGEQRTFLEAISTSKGEPSEDWFLYIGDLTDYHETMGLRPQGMAGFHHA